MPEEGTMRFDLFAEKETTSFRPMTEKQGVTDWFTMRQFCAGGSTSARILGEANPNLDQDKDSPKLEDILGLEVRDNDFIEAKVTYGDVIDATEKVHMF